MKPVSTEKHDQGKLKPMIDSGAGGQTATGGTGAAIPDRPVDREFSWNLVCDGIEADREEALQEVLRRRVDDLAGFLKPFVAEDAVHLHISLSLEKAGEKADALRTRIDLRLPATVLHADAESRDFAESLRGAFDTLEKRLQSYLIALRGEHRWKNFSRKKKRPGSQADDSVGYAKPGFGAPAITGPETREDVIRNFILRHYHRLLLYVHRRIITSESELAMPLTSIDAREVLDEVTRVCLSDPGSKPDALSYELWLYRLIDDELKRICDELSERNLLWDELPFDDDDVDDDRQTALGSSVSDDEGLSFEDWMVASFDRDDTRPDEGMPDSAAVPPDMNLLGKDLVARILEVSSDWTEDQREILQLYFLEGFDAVEIAMIRGMQASQVDEVIGQLRERLRRLVSDESGG